MPKEYIHVVSFNPKTKQLETHVAETNTSNTRLNKKLQDHIETSVRRTKRYEDKNRS